MEAEEVTHSHTANIITTKITAISRHIDPSTNQFSYELRRWSTDRQAILRATIRMYSRSNVSSRPYLEPTHSRYQRDRPDEKRTRRM